MCAYVSIPRPILMVAARAQGIHLLIVAAHPTFLFFCSIRSFSKTTVATGYDDDASAGSAAGKGSATGLTLSGDVDCRHRNWRCWYRWTLFHCCRVVVVVGAVAAAEGGDAAAGDGNGTTHCHRPPYPVAAAVGDCWRTGPADGRDFVALGLPTRRHSAADSSGP